MKTDNLRQKKTELLITLLVTEDVKYQIQTNCVSPPVCGFLLLGRRVKGSRFTRLFITKLPKYHTSCLQNKVHNAKLSLFNDTDSKGVRARR